MIVCPANTVILHYCMWQQPNTTPGERWGRSSGAAIEQQGWLSSALLMMLWRYDVVIMLCSWLVAVAHVIVSSFLLWQYTDKHQYSATTQQRNQRNTEAHTKKGGRGREPLLVNNCASCYCVMLTNDNDNDTPAAACWQHDKHNEKGRIVTTWCGTRTTSENLLTHDVDVYHFYSVTEETNIIANITLLCFLCRYRRCWVCCVCVVLFSVCCFFGAACLFRYCDVLCNRRREGRRWWSRLVHLHPHNNRFMSIHKNNAPTT